MKSGLVPWVYYRSHCRWCNVEPNQKFFTMTLTASEFHGCMLCVNLHLSIVFFTWADQNRCILDSLGYTDSNFTEKHAFGLHFLYKSAPFMVFAVHFTCSCSLHPSELVISIQINMWPGNQWQLLYKPSLNITTITSLDLAWRVCKVHAHYIPLMQEYGVLVNALNGKVP